MSYTAKQWSATIRIIDALAVAVVVFLGWLVWSFYRQSGEIRFPVSIATPFYVAIFVVLRGIAKKEKKKAAVAEASSDAGQRLTDEKKA